MFTAEVQDRGGAAVGTAVFKAPTLVQAVRFVGETTKQDWAGDWFIKGPDGIPVLEGATS